MGSSSPNQGNTPSRYAASRRSGVKSPPAARRPFGTCSARSAGGKGSSGERNGITGMQNTTMPPVTRFAPSPTGYLHLGHVVNAIYVWGLARAAGGRVLLRIEDHDRIRSRPKFEAAILDDLSWLGFIPDEGLVPLRRQSDNGPAYARALATLAAMHDVYACDCSRTQIARARRLTASAGQGAEWYPGTCRRRRLQPGDDVPLGVGIRVQLDNAEERFVDGAVGEVLQTPAEQCGDLLLKDRDGNWTYQFAVTVDDIDDRVDFVV